MKGNKKKSKKSRSEKNTCPAPVAVHDNKGGVSSENDVDDIKRAATKPEQVGETTHKESTTMTRNKCSTSNVSLTPSDASDKLACALHAIEMSTEEDVKLSATQLLIQMAAAEDENHLTFDMIANQSVNSLGILIDSLNAGGSAAYRAALINLINTLINGCPEYIQRVRLRHDLLACGLYEALLGTVERDGSSVEVSRQLDLFFHSESEDNLNGPGRNLIDMLHQIFINVKQSPAEPKLHSLLSALTRLPADRVDVWDRLLAIAHRPPIGWTDGVSQVVANSPPPSATVSEAAAGRPATSPIPVQTILPPPQLRRPRSRSRARTHKGTPPPPAPPIPQWLNSPARLSSTPPPPSSSVTVREQPTLPKFRPTNTIVWESVPQDLLAANAVWNKGYTMMITKDDCKRLEEMFERPVTKRSSPKKSSSVATKTRLLPDKQAVNIGIVLARFRRKNGQQLVDALESPDALKLLDVDTDTLALLLRHFPTDAELMPFRALPQPDDLRDAELFCWWAARKPNLRLIIKLTCLYDEFQTEIGRIGASADAVLNACTAVQTSEGLSTFFHRCLQFGNFINQGSFAAKAVAFKLNSLRDFLNAKGRGGLRMVDLIAESANQLTKQFVDVLCPLQAIKGSSVENMEVALTALANSVEELHGFLSTCGDSALTDRYLAFISKSVQSCADLKQTMQKIHEQEKLLKSFFCAEKLTLEAMLDIVADAANMFRQALKEAEERQSRGRRTRATAGREPFGAVAQAANSKEVTDERFSLLKSPADETAALMNIVRSQLRPVTTSPIAPNPVALDIEEDEDEGDSQQENRSPSLIESLMATSVTWLHSVVEQLTAMGHTLFS